nr:Ankyrin repeat domain containing protein [Hymenolepis microstoma]
MTENEDSHSETQSNILPKSNFNLEEKLCEAAKTNDLNKARRILAERIDPNFLNPFGLSPLHLACQYGNYEIAKLLISNKAEVDFANAIGVTPLHLGAKSNHLKCVQLLLLCGANPSKQTRSQCRAKEFSPKGSRLHNVLEQAEQGILPNSASVFGLNVEPIVPKFSIPKITQELEKKKGKTTKDLKLKGSKRKK